MGICGKQISFFQFYSSNDLFMESFAGSSSGQAIIQEKILSLTLFPTRTKGICGIILSFCPLAAMICS